MRRVVVTGLGLITPVGNDVATTWDALTAGRSGLGIVTRFDASAYDHPIAAEVKGFNAAEVVDPKLARRIDLSSAFALAGAQQAVADARLDITQEDPEQVGVLLGTGMGSAHLIVEGQQILDEKGHRRVSPFMVSHMLPDTATGLVAIALGARGPNFAVTAACATGGAATGEAAEMVARGDCDVMIAGGYEAPLQPIYYAGFNAMKALAEHEDPAKAVRPFDLERNGFILGEGAGVLILEELGHAKARGARIYAEWRAAGTSNDAFDMVAAAEDGHGIAQAMRLAMRRADLQPDDIDYINAHGTGTPLNDRVETKAIRDVFAESADRLLVSSTKSMHGHMMGASGAVEAAIAVLTCHHGVVPPTINYEHPDPACDLDIVPNEARIADVRAAMSTSVGLGGHNSAIIFSKWEDA
ncbi:MAG: beta-ketoacyl-ACP synthase II [Chloroflexi bacterium]|nr:beta-ketoacyl-ACP synthase II [Chloroflexota bacterium]MQC48114.1 beta-ketoacyl-[acyl-carrier-protein] synthase II [Chloroflexota bacterium]